MMADMDEDRLQQFISEHEMQMRMDYQADQLKQEVYGFHPEFIEEVKEQPPKKRKKIVQP